MSEQELLTGVPDTMHERIRKAASMLDHSREPFGLISAAADTYPYVKMSLVKALQEDADLLEGLIE